jgi:hypothetical protein
MLNRSPRTYSIAAAPLSVTFDSSGDTFVSIAASSRAVSAPEASAAARSAMSWRAVSAMASADLPARMLATRSWRVELAFVRYADASDAEPSDVAGSNSPRPRSSKMRMTEAAAAPRNRSYQRACNPIGG